MPRIQDVVHPPRSRQAATAFRTTAAAQQHRPPPRDSRSRKGLHRAEHRRHQHDHPRRAQLRGEPPDSHGPQVPGAPGRHPARHQPPGPAGAGPPNRRPAPLPLRLDLLRHPRPGRLLPGGPQAPSALQDPHPHLPGLRPVLPGGQDQRVARGHRQGPLQVRPRQRRPRHTRRSPIRH